MTQTTEKTRRKPKFLRQDIHKKKKLKRVWRKPKGIHSKLRRARRGKRKHPSVGYGKQRKHHYKTPIRIASINGIENVEKGQVILIERKVGLRKKIELIKKAESKGLTVFGIKDAKEFIKKVEEEKKKLGEEKEKKKKKEEKEKSQKKEKEETKEEKEKKEKEEKRKVLEKKTK